MLTETAPLVMDVPAGIAVIVAAFAAGILAILSGVILWWLRQIEKRSDLQESRIAEQATRILKLESRDRTSWLYIQRLILHANTHAPGVPIPEPPNGWLEDD